MALQTGDNLLGESIVANRYIIPSVEITKERTLYENYVQCNINNLDGIAYFTDEKAVTHKEFKEAVDALSAGMFELLEYGNIRVGAILQCQKEAPICLLATNKLGGTIKYIDFSKGPADIVGNIIESNFDVIIMDELFIEIEKVANRNNVPVIVVNPTREYNEDHYFSFEEVISRGRERKGITAPFEQNKPAVIISSSGTTGVPKPIVHTNETINMAVNKILHTDLMVQRGHVMLSCIPPFIGLGLVTTMYSSLIAGMGLLFVTGMGPEETVLNVGNIVKHFREIRTKYGLSESVRLNIFAAPIFYRYFAMCDDLKDMSFMGGMLSAGSRMGKTELAKMSEVFAARGCNIPVCNGYGQNEMCGAVTLNSISNNKNGTGGLITINTEIIIVDSDTNEILEIGQEGKILEKSDSQFLCYENMPEETEKAFIFIEGEKWFDTKDLGYIDEDGYIHITGRETRVIVRQDMKLVIDSIERKIKAHPMIIDCAIVPRQTDVDEEAVAFVKLKEKCDIKIIIDEIQSSENPMSHLEMPAEFIVLDEIPYLGSGKIDYMSLKRSIK